MCGRYSFTTPEEAARQLFGYKGMPLNLRARYNAAPTQMMPVVRRTADGGRELVMMRWGLIPAWAKDAKIGNSAINARSETADEKPMFRSAFKSRRCLIPADGFYEWLAGKDGKQPYRIELPNRAPFAFAGLWENWKATAGTKFAEPGSPVQTYTIMTTDPSKQIAHIHDRMPVILPPQAYDRWLDPNTTADDLKALLVPFRGKLNAYPVSRRVNTPKNDDADLLAPIPA